jgi:hypothetical protein
VGPYEPATLIQLPLLACGVQLELGEHAGIVPLILSVTATSPKVVGSVLLVKEGPLLHQVGPIASATLTQLPPSLGNVSPFYRLD